MDFLFNGGGGFCVNDGGWIFCLLCVWAFVFMVVVGFFCLMLVVGYLFIVMTEFFVYGSDCVFVLMVVVGFWFMVVGEFLFNVGGEFFCLL